MDQEATVAQIARWAAADENIRTVLVTGSAARGDHDELSDVDVELYLRDPSALLHSRSWYEQFGEVLAVEELDNADWMPTRLLYLVDGKIDFAIGGTDSLGAHRYVRPFRVLIDKDNKGSRLSVTPLRSSAPPTADDYQECVNWFAAAALMQAKLIVREEPWAAKYRDWDLKQQLLRMLEWEHRCRYGWHYDTWYNGKHLDGWVDPSVRIELDACWAGFYTSEMASALRASMDLFQRLGEHTAQALDFPTFHHGSVRTEVERILNLMEATE